MSAVARLVLTYLTRTPGLRWLSLGGALGIVLGPLLLPDFASNDVTTIVIFLACVAAFLGAGLMPMMVARMALSRSICVLPYGRLELFLSALITVMLVSIPLPLLGVLGQLVATPKATLALYTHAQLWGQAVYLFWSFYVGTFLAATWLYVAIGFATFERNAAGLAKCLLVILFVIYAPSQRIVKLDPQLELTAWESIVNWSVIGLWIANAHRLRGRAPLAAFGRALARRLRIPGAAGRTRGHELDLLLGTHRPWLMVLAIVFPMAIQTLVGFRLQSAWLLYFTLFSAVSGALAGRAAERSRALWLRARWTREELFSRVEAAFWKHNAYALVVLLLLLVAVTHLHDLPARVTMLGAPLLALGMFLSTCLGLTMTRGLRWPESTLAIVSMLALMGVAALASNERADTRVVVASEVVLACAAVALRFLARHRWRHLDWTLCRPDQGEASRVAS